MVTPAAMICAARMGSGIALRVAESVSGDSHYRIRSRYEIAHCLWKSEDVLQAITLFESILEDSLAENKIREKALLSLAHLLSETGRYTEAITFYKMYLNQFRDTPLSSYVLFKIGKITLQNLGLWDEGFSILQRIWRD